MQRSIFKFGNEVNMALFIAELIKTGITFDMKEEGNTYVITYLGGY